MKKGPRGLWARWPSLCRWGTHRWLIQRGDGKYAGSGSGGSVYRRTELATFATDGLPSPHADFPLGAGDLPDLLATH